MILTLALPRLAAAQTCGADAEARSTGIRRFLDREAKRARTWDLTWALVLGAAAAGQGALLAAEWHPLNDYDDDVRAGLIVGTSKAGIATLPHIILPLKIVRPAAPSGDACADLAAAERALRETAKNEKKAFILNHVGNVVLSGGGLLILGLGFDTWKEGATSAATGYPTGLLVTYTLPRASWKVVRGGYLEQETALDLRIAPAIGPGFAGLVVGGYF